MIFSLEPISAITGSNDCVHIMNDISKLFPCLSLSGSFKNSSLVYDGPSTVSIWNQQAIDIEKFGMQVNFVYRWIVKPVCQFISQPYGMISGVLVAFMMGLWI